MSFLLGTPVQQPTVQPDILYPKPFTVAEQQAKRSGELYLQMAKQYAGIGDQNNAVSCCLEGILLIFGLSRPLAVRDQFDDLLRIIDPANQIANRIRSSLKSLRHIDEFGRPEITPSAGSAC